MIHLFADDAPDRPGSRPKLDDPVWVFKTTLHDGERLHLHLGEATHDAFKRMVLGEMLDDHFDLTLPSRLS